MARAPRKPRAPKAGSDNPTLPTETPIAVPALVKVRCVTYAKPFTEQGPLNLGDVADVSPALAEVLVRNGHVEIVQ